MPRESVTYAQVEAVANELTASGIKEPGAKAIREVLARRTDPGQAIGSPNTIQRHLATWRRERQVSLVDNPTLPQALAGDLARALNVAVGSARAEKAAKLAQLEAEQQDLVAVGERAEARIEELERELETTTSQRDTLQGHLAEHVARASLHAAELESIRGCLKTRDEELARADRNTALSEARAAELDRSWAADREKWRVIHEKADADQATARQASHSSDIRAASAEARVDELKDAKKQLEAQVSTLNTSVAQLSDEARRVSAAEAESAILREQVRLLETTNSLFKQLLQKAGALSA